MMLTFTSRGSDDIDISGEVTRTCLKRQPHHEVPEGGVKMHLLYSLR